MQQLLAFIEQRLHLIVFALLQVICGFLVFRLNPFQQASFTQSANSVTDATNNISSEVSAYFDLKYQNKLLQDQVANQFKNSTIGTLLVSGDTIALKDTSRKSLYDVIPAQVVYNTTFKANNVFVINKGQNHGIKKNMGVISSEGLAGIVLQSTANYSTVMSLLNTNMTVIPNINGMEYYTKLLWINEAPNVMHISGINKLEKLKIGDEVKTGKSSMLFPSGLSLGTITKLDKNPKSQYYETEIATATNFRSLEYVFVIINRDIEQMESLISDND
ncbi:MAG: rod shape-determining protein MreC [Bacteroidia bacterium]|jgi:rod shape-determining protein MreC